MLKKTLYQASLTVVTSPPRWHGRERCPDFVQFCHWAADPSSTMLQRIIGAIPLAALSVSFLSSSAGSGFFLRLLYVHPGVEPTWYYDHLKDCTVTSESMNLTHFSLNWATVLPGHHYQLIGTALCPSLRIIRRSGHTFTTVTLILHDLFHLMIRAIVHSKNPENALCQAKKASWSS